MADITGPRGTGNISQSLRQIEMRRAVYELEPSSAPLTILTERLGSEATANPEFSWQEDDLEPRFDTVNFASGYTGTDTSIVVAHGSYFAQHDLVKVTATGEVMRVVSVATNTLTVVRGVGGNAGAIANLGELIIIGSAQPEGDTSKPARSSNPTKVSNYTQILRKPFESTETLRHSNTFTAPSDWDRQAKHAGIEHDKDIESAYLWGKPSEDLSGSQPRRTTGGAYYFVRTNITSAGGQLTEQEFFGAFSAAFRYGNTQTKTAFMSRLATDVLNGFPRGKLELVQSDNDSTYGINVMRYVSPHGVLNCITHNMLEGSKYGGDILILDLSNVMKRPLANSEGSRDTHIRENIQPPDADTRKDEYLTEAGLEFGLELTHALITGITS